MGGLAYVLPDGATLLQVLVADTGHGTWSTLAHVSSYGFPLGATVPLCFVYADHAFVFR